MKKPKTFEAPLKSDWDRAEYLQAQKTLSALQKKPFTMFIFCGACKKEVKSKMIHVVAFGKEVACDTCFRKKWSKLRNRMGTFAIPEELDEHFDDKPDDEQVQKQVQDVKDRILEIQNEHCDELRERMDTEFKP